MPELHTLALFSLAALALTMTPGPDMLLIASRTIAQGRAAGFATWAGIAAGTYCHGIAAALGLSQLFIAVPVAYDVVRYFGAAYLLYLAWSTLVSARQATDPVTGQQLELRAKKDAPIRTNLTMFQQGLLTNLLNPKVILFVLALIPQFVDMASGSVALQIMVFVTIINIVGFLINGTVILMAASVTAWLGQGTRAQAWPGYLLSTVFAGLALRLLLDERA